MSGERLMEFRKRQAIAEIPTQITGAIRPIRLMNTDAMPAITPDIAIIHIASIHTVLIRINPICAKIVLGGFRIAFMGKCLEMTDAVYRIADVYFNQDNVGEIMARMERLSEAA